MKASALAVGALAGLFVASAGAVTVVVDDFGAGVTTVNTSVNGSGSTTAPGIQAGFASGDPTRYFAWTTGDGQSVQLDNQTVPGVLSVSHGGGGSQPTLSLSYLFSTPTDLGAFGVLNVRGSGTGPATVYLQLTDADGDVLSQQLTLPGGAFGDLQASFASMSCLALGGGSCDLTGITMVEYAVDGIGASGFRQRIDAIEFASLDAITPVTPIPEPQTYALLALGLPLVGWVARRRRTRQG